MTFTDDDRDAVLYAMMLAAHGHTVAIQIGRRIVSVAKDDLSAARALMEGPMRHLKSHLFKPGFSLSIPKTPRRPPDWIRGVPRLRDTFPSKGV